MAKGDLHISRRFVHSDLNLTESDVKVITNNRIESPFRSMRDSHSVSSFTPDKGKSAIGHCASSCAALSSKDRWKCECHAWQRQHCCDSSHWGLLLLRPSIHVSNPPAGGHKRP